MPLPEEPVLIIGGGISGLALAQGLKQSHIPFRVFENDPTPEFRPQGYRFRVNGDGAGALQELLPPELWQRFEKVCAKLLSFGVRLDALSGQPMKNPFGNGPPRGGPGKAYTADRTVTRDLLLRGLEDNVFFGKRLLRYEETEDAVSAFFADGSSATGSFLVGAEGVRSVVRKQHLLDFRVLDTECRLIYGKTKLTEALIQGINPPTMNGMSVVVDESRRNPLIILLEVIRFQDNDLRPELPEDYIYWVLGGDKADFEKSDHEFLHMTGQQAVELSLKITEKWDPSFRILLELQEKDMTSALRITMASPEMSDWQTSARVTLMGDAAHVMPPTGGVGANTALQDAAALYQALQDGMKLENITKYDDEMRQRAREAISGSARGGKHLLGMRDWTTFKPVEM